MNAAAAANTSLSVTLQQLYATTAAGEPAAGAPGHIMYSSEPPLVDPLGDEDFYAYTSTQGRGVLVRPQLPVLPLLRMSPVLLAPPKGASIRTYHGCWCHAHLYMARPMPSTCHAGVWRGARVLACAQRSLLPAGATRGQLPRQGPAHPLSGLRPSHCILVLMAIKRVLPLPSRPA